MRMTKQQIKVVDIIHSGGWVWTAAGKPYTAVTDKDGRVRSTPLHNKTFETMKENGIIRQEGNRWVLS